MRQLRLCSKDQTFSVITSVDMPLSMQADVKAYMEINRSQIKNHVFLEKPNKVEINHHLFLLGSVSQEQTVIPLPESGYICILPCKGGFLIAAEYEN